MYRDDLIETRRGTLRQPEPRPELRPPEVAWLPGVASAERLPDRVVRPKVPRPSEIGCTDWYIYPLAAPRAGGDGAVPRLAAKFAAMKRRVTPDPRAWVKRPSDDELETVDAIKAP